VIIKKKEIRGTTHPKAVENIPHEKTEERNIIDENKLLIFKNPPF